MIAALPLARFYRRLSSLFLITLLCTSLAGCGVNTIPTLDEQVNASWAQVQNQYKRRSDLVPNLVETVKGYAKHEENTLKEVIEARAKATSVTLSPEMLSNPEMVKKFEDSQSALSGALGRLMVVSEQYPDLKANQGFLALQSQLEGTENRITVVRQDFIAAVQKYNTEVRTFPGRFWAWIYNAKAKETFKAPESAADAPAVKF